MHEPVPPQPPSLGRRGGRRRPAAGWVCATCRVGALDLGPNLALALLDLSETGARLVVRQALEVGQDVVVGLGRADGSRPAARPGSVVWCLPCEGGAHCLGIRFQRRLPLKDFIQLTVERPARGVGRPPLPSPAPQLDGGPIGGGAEKRRAARHAPHVMRLCRVSPAGRPDLEATLLDISESGAGLMASGPLAPDEAVVLHLEGVGEGPPLALPARVVYSVELFVGWFLAGAEFARPLTPAQLLPILARIGRLAPGGRPA